jgi:hypothetical protein
VAHAQTRKHLPGGPDVLRWQPPLDIESQPYGFTTSLVSGNPTNQELAKENWAIGEWAPVHVLAKRATDLAGI